MNIFSKNYSFGEEGFSLVEALVAIVVMLIVLLSVFTVFTYSIVFNTGNNYRSQALSVLQREVELTRSAKFTPVLTDSTLVGGVKADKVIQAADGSSYKVSVTVDDDPYQDDVQADATKTLKEITIVVTPFQKVAQWQTAVSAQITMRRARGN